MIKFPQFRLPNLQKSKMATISCVDHYFYMIFHQIKLGASVGLIPYVSVFLQENPFPVIFEWFNVIFAVPIDEYNIY